MTIRGYLVVALAIGLAACQSAAETQASIQADVAAAEVTLTQLETLAAQYEKLPDADPTIVAKLKSLDNAAYGAVKTAESAASSAALTAALTAISAFQTAVQGTPALAPTTSTVPAAPASN